MTPWRPATPGVSTEEENSPVHRSIAPPPDGHKLAGALATLLPEAARLLAAEAARLLAVNLLAEATGELVHAGKSLLDAEQSGDDDETTRCEYSRAGAAVRERARAVAEANDARAREHNARVGALLAKHARSPRAHIGPRRHCARAAVRSIGARTAPRTVAKSSSSDPAEPPSEPHGERDRRRFRSEVSL